MITNKEYKNAWDNRVTKTTAHIDISHYHKDGENKLFKIYEKQVLRQIKKMKNITLLDYGCGGGWLGRYLLNHTAVKKYIGLDISKRSIDFAKDLLLPNKKVTLQEIALHAYNLKKYKANIIVALSVIHHFPTIDIVGEFLKQVNDSECDLFILQFREGEKVVFAEQPYKTTKEINLANELTLDFIEERLYNYVSEILSDKGKHVYIKFIKKVSDD
jgi:2-polyprenyl-3-methyl-5-hydroxy-6-metoxy-1,4-benzoquinol methylase